MVERGTSPTESPKLTPQEQAFMSQEGMAVLRPIVIYYELVSNVMSEEAIESIVYINLDKRKLTDTEYARLEKVHLRVVPASGNFEKFWEFFQECLDRSERIKQEESIKPPGERKLDEGGQLFKLSYELQIYAEELRKKKTITSSQPRKYPEKDYTVGSGSSRSKGDYHE